MPIGRPIPSVIIDARMREQLQTMSRSRSLFQALAQRAKMILLAADGLNNSTIAVQLGLSRPTAGKWRRRFLSQGLAGLYEEARPGAPRAISDEKVAALLSQTLNSKTKAATHWTCRSLAAGTGVSFAMVYRL
jgi:putative transposase